jgi:tetraacyldisaccharide 4'-kinase
MHAPLFWKYKTRLSNALLPASSVYAFFAARRQKTASPLHLSVPVICIGNVVIGGSGKTPVALALGALLKAQGMEAHYLTRGYKGKLYGPVRVDPAVHSARDVGDEPLLLAEILPTWVAKNRVEGAKAAIEAGAKMILMDDGFQNPTVHKDVSLLVVDGGYGFGNNRILPAGPLRETVSEAMKRAAAVVLVGDDFHHVLEQVPAGLPVLRAAIKPLPVAERLRGMTVMAFAGIARPRKFYRTLQDLGCDVRRMMAFPDHHMFTSAELAFLQKKAGELEARLVTTAKDYARLPADIKQHVTYVPVEAVFEDAAALLSFVPRPRG